MAPAIHDVNEKKLDELMRDPTDLVGRARAGSLRSSEMSDPTITLTNLGDKGVDAVFGVIYPPQVAIVGSASPRSGWSWSTAASGWPPRCGPVWLPTTGPATVRAVRCSWPRSTGCCSSPKNCRGDDMSRAEIRDGVVAQLIAIAPEVEEVTCPMASCCATRSTWTRWTG